MGGIGLGGGRSMPYSGEMVLGGTSLRACLPLEQGSRVRF
jgi:hypothetical protein